MPGLGLGELLIDDDGDGLDDGEELVELDALLDTEEDIEEEIDALVELDGELDTEELGDGEEDGEEDAELLTDEDGDGLLETELEGDGELLTDDDGLGEDDGLLEIDVEGLGELDIDDVLSVKMSHDIAPSSAFVPPVQVRVAVPAVVENAVVKRKVPASTSRFSVSPDHVLATVSVAPQATAIIPPPVAIVVEPVVRASVASMSVEPSPPEDENAPSTTL